MTLDLSKHVGETNKRDTDGLVMPWYTWPALEALKADEACLRGRRIFEWGTGFSTIWYASRGAEIFSVDHDHLWTQAILGEMIEMRLRGGVLTIHAPADEELVAVKHPYCLALREQYEIIVVDGVLRPACALRAMHFVSPGGLIILDNSDRPEMELPQKVLAAAAFLPTHFDQPDRPWRTSFWRSPH